VITMRRLRRLAGRAGLYVVTGSLFLSGSMRLVDSAEGVFSQTEIASAAHAEEPGHNSDGDMDKPLTQMDMASFDPAGLSSLVESLNEREASIARKEAAIEKRIADLAMAEQALTDNLELIRLAEERLKATLALADGALEGDIAHLTSVYESMKPKDAAILFEQMDPKFAAGFLSRMTPASASGIMAGLAPETAYAISLIFAGRHIEVPRE